MFLEILFSFSFSEAFLTHWQYGVFVTILHDQSSKLLLWFRLLVRCTVQESWIFSFKAQSILFQRAVLFLKTKTWFSWLLYKLNTFVNFLFDHVHREQLFRYFNLFIKFCGGIGSYSNIKLKISLIHVFEIYFWFPVIDVIRRVHLTLRHELGHHACGQ